ncbi:MAG: subclass B3 metallo-beta-lactamase [Rudaea sp.]
MQRFAAAALTLLASHAFALSPESEAKNQPVAPFKIIDNIYYVGASDVTAYLFVTSKGMILLDGGFAETAPQIEKNIASLGFKLSDVKILINGHAHPDHAGGLAQLKRDTGATFEAMAQEVQPLEHAGKGTFYRGEKDLFESIPVDRTLHDGDTVKLGDTTLVAHLTAGHSPGCTTWTTTVKAGDKTLSAAFVCQLSLPAGQALVGNTFYPSIADDFKLTFSTLAALPCDIFLAEHGRDYDLNVKIAKMKNTASTNPFIDPAGYRALIEKSRVEFEDALAEQRAK